MSSPINSPRERPMSEIPTSPHPRGPFKTFGQEYQYAETLQNPFPEVIFAGPANAAHGTAPTSPVSAGGADGTNEPPTDHGTLSSHRPATTGSKEPVMHEDVWVEPAEAPWYTTISRRKWAAIIICTVGITGVMLAILGAMNKLSGTRSTPTTNPDPDSPTPSKTSADQTSSSDAPSSASSTPAAAATTLTTSTTSVRPTSTNHPSPKVDCTNPSTFLTPIFWIGTTVGAYNGAFAQAASAQACCTSCLNQPGCAGWLYDASSKYTPCTKVVVSRAMDDKGGGVETCPLGRAPTTYFSEGRDGEIDTSAMDHGKN
ncbi:hypothetical protein C8A01DRAFT_36660 [Parachaetomium inaequale]|uniref:Uncharacterized protein n=1 Tax=Parachaetomium inaequale TaxID=2588326 RepID=A0AAN6SR96_9PEZI|nr:hypothetical protein C8A01DRAFT_36660 [Parachaetomium inaequale]